MKFLIIYLGLCFFTSATYAQQPLSSDELFNGARVAAFENKDLDKAKDLAIQALVISPGYADIEIFLGRIYSWDHQYDSAEFHFTRVLNADSVNEEASIAFADIEYWQGQYETSLVICNKGLIAHPKSPGLLIRKARNLSSLKKFSEAKTITHILLAENPKNEEAIKLAGSIRDEAAVNRITLGYDLATFDKQYQNAWHLGSIAYSRLTKFGTVIGRVNYANRFQTDGLQAEVDAYPRLSNVFYAYVNAGYSENAGVFPKYRTGFSLYANLPKSYEAEAGWRYLYFSEATNIYTFAVGKYYKNFLFNARTYLTPSAGNFSQSYNFDARYYFSGADDYGGLSLGTGFSPDDNYQNVQFGNKQTMLSSRKISATFNHTFLKMNIISLTGGLINQEYLPGEKGNQYNLSLSLGRRF